MKSAAFTATALAGALLGPAAGAQQGECGSAGRPRVDVSGAGADVDRITALLRVELAPRGLDVCALWPDGAGSPSLAAVSVSARPGGALVEVEVHDSLTAKRVSRDVDLAEVPADSRSLTVALVAEELLRASWAEIALRRAPPPAQPVPSGVRDAVRDDLPASASAGGLALRGEVVAAGEVWAGSLGIYGVDVRLGVALPAGVAATARVGVRDAPAVSAADGRIHPSVILAGVGLSFPAVPPGGRYGVDALARADVARVTYDPAPSAAGAGVARSDATVLLGAGVDGWIALGASASVLAEVLVDTPTRPVAANDAGQSVVALSGGGIESGVGIRVAF